MKKLLPDVVRNVFSSYGRPLHDSEIDDAQWRIYKETDCYISEEKIKRWNDNYWYLVNRGITERGGGLMKLIMGITIVLLFFLCVPAGAAEDDWFSWDRANTYLHIPLTVTMAIDLGQTLDIAHNPDRYHEDNPILGRHPKEHEVYQYFIASYAVTTVAVYILPKKASRLLQAGVIALEVGVTAQNYNLGLRVRF